MGENVSSEEDVRRRHEWRDSVEGRVMFFVVVGVGLLVNNVLKKPSGPESSSPASVPTSISATTENVTPSPTFEGIKKKLEEDLNYKLTREEKILFAKMGIAVNDGEPIPYEGDDKEEEQK